MTTDRLIVVRQRVRKLLHSKSYARLQTKKGAHQPLISAQKSPDQVTSAVHAWLAVRRPHATTPGDDGLPMASGGTRQVPTTAMTGGMSSGMLRHVTSPSDEEQMAIIFLCSILGDSLLALKRRRNPVQLDLIDLYVFQRRSEIRH